MCGPTLSDTPCRVKCEVQVSSRKFMTLFEKRRQHAVSTQPGLQVSAQIGDPSEFPKPRDYAYSAWDGEQALIVFAPKILRANQARQDALIRHELGHALLQSAGLDHSERECDAVAERIFGDKIYYDSDDVQTLNSRVAGATRPRPSYLPTGKEPKTRRNCGSGGCSAGSGSCGKVCCGSCPSCPFAP